MLLVSELNKIQGLLNYMNSSVNTNAEVRVDDFDVIDSNGEVAARCGYDADAGEYVLLEVPGKP